MMKKRQMIKKRTELQHIPWEDDEDRITHFYVTANPFYYKIRLKDPHPGEIALEKRTFLREARLHKKRENTNPNGFFLSELMLYVMMNKSEETYI